MGVSMSSPAPPICHDCFRAFAVGLPQMRLRHVSVGFHSRNPLDLCTNTHTRPRDANNGRRTQVRKLCGFFVTSRLWMVHGAKGGLGFPVPAACGDRPVPLQAPRGLPAVQATPARREHAAPVPPARASGAARAQRVGAAGAASCVSSQAGGTAGRQPLPSILCRLMGVSFFLEGTTFLVVLKDNQRENQHVETKSLNSGWSTGVQRKMRKSLRSSAKQSWSSWLTSRVACRASFCPSWASTIHTSSGCKLPCNSSWRCSAKAGLWANRQRDLVLLEGAWRVLGVCGQLGGKLSLAKVLQRYWQSSALSCP